jgi:hypothetical protein
MVTRQQYSDDYGWHIGRENVWTAQATKLRLRWDSKLPKKVR